MVHGAPDNFEVQQKATTFRLDDMAELAVRLGVPQSIDRLGEVIFYDSFEDGLTKWYIDLIGADSKATIETMISKSKGFSCKLVVDSEADSYIDMRSYQSYRIISNLGIEFNYATSIALDYIKIKLKIYTGTVSYSSIIKIDQSNEKIQYLDKNGVYQDLIESYIVYHGVNAFQTIKLVIDPTNESYKRLKIPTITYDLSGYELRKLLSDVKPHILSEISFYSTLGIEGIIYIDDIIITQNEP